MSIEALIQAHTEALLANTEALKLLTISLAGRTPAKAEDKPKADKAVAKVEAVKEVMLENVKKGDNEYSPERPPVPYETVRALVLKLAGGGKREEIKALNTKHGIANLKVLLDKEDDFSTVNDQAKLEAVYADLQKLEG